MTALIWASGRGHIECVKALLDAGAAPDSADKVNIDSSQYCWDIVAFFFFDTFTLFTCVNFNVYFNQFPSPCFNVV